MLRPHRLTSFVFETRMLEFRKYLDASKVGRHSKFQVHIVNLIALNISMVFIYTRFHKKQLISKHSVSSQSAVGQPPANRGPPNRKVLLSEIVTAKGSIDQSSKSQPRFSATVYLMKGEKILVYTVFIAVQVYNSFQGGLKRAP